MPKHQVQTAPQFGSLSIVCDCQNLEYWHLVSGRRSTIPVLSAFLSVAIGLLATSVWTAELAYDSYKIDIGEESEVVFLFSGSFTGKDKDDLVFVTRTKEQDEAEPAQSATNMGQLTVYSYEDDDFSRVLSIDVPIGQMDTSRSAEGVDLLSSHARGVDKFNPSSGTFEPWLDLRERGSQQPSTKPEFLFNFARDLNGDGLDDIVYVHDESLVVRVQLPDGSLTEPVVLSSNPGIEVRSRYPLDAPLDMIRASMRLETTGNVAVQIQYSLYAIDYDGDWSGDLAVPYFDQETYDQIRRESQNDGKDDAAPERHPTFEASGLRVHRGLEGEGWAAKPLTVHGPAGPSLSEAWTEGSLFELHDFNGDGVYDAAVFGIVNDQVSYMDFFFGRRENGEMQFRETADTRITMTSALVVMTELSDLDGDGDVDFCAVPLRIGIGTIVSGLVRRSVRITLSCYLMNDGVYPKEPSKQWSRRLPLNVPTPDAMADVSGDGIVDMVIPTRRNRLEIFAGTGKADLFADQPIKVDLDLPQGENTILFRDLNRDGKADMLVVPTESGQPVWVALSR